MLAEYNDSIWEQFLIASCVFDVLRSFCLKKLLRIHGNDLFWKIAICGTDDSVNKVLPHQPEGSTCI